MRLPVAPSFGVLYVGCLFFALAILSTNARLDSPPMGWSTWESLAKNVSDNAILMNIQVLEDTGLKSKGYDLIQIDDGWMMMDRATGWISRENYETKPQNSKGPGGLPGFSNGVPGCMLADAVRFPRGMKALGIEVKQRGFKYGLYTSGELFVCDSNPSFRGFYASGTYQNLRGIDAACFVDWGVDLMKVDMCKPPTRKNTYAQSVMRAWRKLLPENVIIYNSRYGCLAKSRCSGRSSIYRCPFSVNFRANRIVPSYCAATADLARLGQDMKPVWGNIVAGLLSRIGRGVASKPGFWSDPDYLVPHESALTFTEARAQFSAWCITSSPLLISVEMTKMSKQTIEMLGNLDAIRVNQQYFNEGGDMWEMKGVLWTFTKRLSQTETAFLAIHVGAQYAQGKGLRTEDPVTYQFQNVARFGNKLTKACHYKNIWDETEGDLHAGSTFVVERRDVVFLIVNGCHP